MSENKHTPEPWYVVDKPWGDGTWINSGSPDPHHEGFVADCEDMNGDVDKDTARINARRIVACVNACAGSSTEWLEFSVSEDCAELSGPFEPLETRITSILKTGIACMVERNQMRKQRDDLLAALLEISQVACDMSSEKKLADDAIASVKGQK